MVRIVQVAQIALMAVVISQGVNMKTLILLLLTSTLQAKILTPQEATMFKKSVEAERDYSKLNTIASQLRREMHVTKDIRERYDLGNRLYLLERRMCWLRKLK